MLHHRLRALRALGVFAIPVVLGLAAVLMVLFLSVVICAAIGVVAVFMLRRYLFAPKRERRGEQTIIPPPSLDRPRWRPFRSEPAGFFTHDR